MRIVRFITFHWGTAVDNPSIWWQNIIVLIFLPKIQKNPAPSHDSPSKKVKNLVDPEKSG